VPLYYQLQEILKEEIEAGRWSPGTTIPSEAALASLFGISRTVIRKALDILEGDAQVVRIKGKGTVVTEAKVSYDAVAAAALFSRGIKPERSKLDRVVTARLVQVGRQLGSTLGVPSTASVVELACVHSVRGVPAAFTDTYLRVDASPQLKRLCAGESASGRGAVNADEAVKLARAIGKRVHASEVAVEATLANEYESELMGIRVNTPVFLVSTIDRLADDKPVAFTRMVALSDTFRFVARIRGKRQGQLGLSPDERPDSGASLPVRSPVGPRR
jgi:GntR family transcriptional regulator